MSVIHFNQATTLSPEQFVAGLTDFGPGTPITIRTELAHRSTAGVDVTLMWVRRYETEAVVICVCDQHDGAYFEIEP